MAAPRFEVIEEPDSTPEPEESGLAFHGLMLALKALSQRALVAISNLFCLLTVGSAFWLSLTIHDPNWGQLVELGGYFLFVLAANLIVRKY